MGEGKDQLADDATSVMCSGDGLREAIDVGTAVLLRQLAHGMRGNDWREM